MEISCLIFFIEFYLGLWVKQFGAFSSPKSFKQLARFSDSFKPCFKATLSFSFILELRLERSHSSLEIFGDCPDKLLRGQVAASWHAV
jgi:hypothetical protein